MPSRVMAEIGNWVGTGQKVGVKLPKDIEVIIERIERLEKDHSESIAWKGIKRTK